MSEPTKDIPVAKPIKVTISEPETGEILEERILQNDFFLIPHGSVYLDSSQFYGNGTTVLTLKRRSGNA